MELGGARELELSRRARALFADVAAKYQNLAAVDKVANVALQVEEVKGVMQNNINAVLKVRTREFFVEIALHRPARQANSRKYQSMEREN